MRAPRRAAVTVAAAILMFSAPMGAAYALWTATATVTVGVTIAPGNTSSAAPSGLNCSGSNVAQASLTWTAPVGITPMGYELYLVSTGDTLKTVTTTSTTVSEVELPGNQTVTVGVRAIYERLPASTGNPTVSFSQNQGRDGRVTCGSTS